MKIKGLLAATESERENQATSPPPLRVVLLLDCSGSLKEHLEAVKRAAFGLADQIKEKGKVGVVSFGGDGVQIRSKLTADGRALKKAFAALKAGGGAAKAGGRGDPHPLHPGEGPPKIRAGPDPRHRSHPGRQEPDAGKEEWNCL